MNCHKRTVCLPILFVLVSGIIGLAACLGWILDIRPFFQLEKGLAPTQFNTGLCFVLMSVASLGYFCKKEKLVYIASFLAFLFSGLSLVEYAFHIDLQIDELFVKHSIIDRTAYRGRMSIFTAINFMDVSFALFVKGIFGRFFKRWIYPILLIISFSVCISILIFYYENYSPIPGIGSTTGMAPQTAVAFCFISLSLLLYELFLIRKYELINFPSWVPLGSFILVIIISLFLWVFSKDAQVAQDREILYQKAKYFSAAIEEQKENSQKVLSAILAIDIKRDFTDRMNVLKIAKKYLDSELRVESEILLYDHEELFQNLNTFREKFDLRNLKIISNLGKHIGETNSAIVSNGSGYDMIFVIPFSEAQFGVVAVPMNDILKSLTSFFFSEEKIGVEIIDKGAQKKIYSSKNAYSFSKGTHSYALDTKFDPNIEIIIYGENFQEHYAILSYTLLICGLGAGILVFIALYFFQRFTTVKNRLLSKVKEDYEKFFFQTDAVLQALAEGVVILNLKGVITFMNKDAEKILGYQEKELLGRHGHHLFFKEEWCKHACCENTEECPIHDFVCINISRKEQFLTERVFVSKSGGSIDADCTIAPILNSFNRTEGVVITFRDIREKKLQEKNLEYAMTENKELEEFAHAVSHDLRAPLVSTGGFSREITLSMEKLKKLLRERELPDSVSECLSEIEESNTFISRGVKRLDELIDGFLKLSKIHMGGGELRLVDVNLLVEEIEETLRGPLKDKKGKIIIKETLPKIFADSLVLWTIFQNLLDNAVKYASPERDLEIEVSSYEDQGKIYFNVKDNGIGFPKNAEHKVFQLFWRSNKNPKIQGTGLGLSMIKKILQKNKGDITCSSKDGEGAVFTFYLLQSGIEEGKGNDEVFGK